MKPKWKRQTNAINHVAIDVGAIRLSVHRLGTNTNWLASSSLFSCINLQTIDLDNAKREALAELEHVLHHTMFDIKKVK